MGRMTASLSDAFAPSSPATSSHLTFGVSDKIAPDRPARSFFTSGSPSSSPSFLPHQVGQCEAKDQGFTHFFAPLTDPSAPTAALAFLSPAVAKWPFNVSARARYSFILVRMRSLDFSFFSSVASSGSVVPRSLAPRLRTLQSKHEIVQRVLILLVSFGVVLFDIFVNRTLNDLDGFLDN